VNRLMTNPCLTRRQFLASTTAATAVATAATAGGLRMSVLAAARPAKARIALTLDLEMSRHYPRRGLTEWDYQKGNLDKATKAYSLKAARVAHDRGARIHFFCVGRVLEQPDVGWLKEIIEMGHPVGNHTYDHINVHATDPRQTQFRFQRAPWLLRGRTARQVIEQNIATTSLAMKTRLGISPNGFRTPGGFYTGLKGRKDLQQMMMQMQGAGQGQAPGAPGPGVPPPGMGAPSPGGAGPGPTPGPGPGAAGPGLRPEVMPAPGLGIPPPAPTPPGMPAVPPPPPSP